MRSALRRRLLVALTGDPEGRTAWITEVADGDDEGYFGPESPTWVVHGDMPTLVAGIRALLMQTLHPGAMAGVHDWSRYRTDAAGRLTGTIRWIVAVTFGSRAQADRESARVGRFHDRVSGTYRTDPAGDGIPYSAHDPELLDWVHLAFTEAFLGCQETWGRPVDADRYVADWATAGRLVGARRTPSSRAELHAQLEDLRARGVLRRDERVDDAVRFLRTPPIAGSGLAYRILFAGAVASIPPEFRRLLGLRRPWWPAIATTRLLLRAAAWVLAAPNAPSPSAREFALARVARLRAASVEK
jgi:uncharacterized protein (DUF2236 family)